ncbi:AraM protein [Thermotoga sp. KOL6]|nr:AraM protein [Thermotoga sp. KOL6]
MRDIFGENFKCVCGKEHSVPSIEIIESSIKEVPNVFPEAFFVADRNTALLVNLPGGRYFVFEEGRPLATMENVKKIAKVSKDFPEIVSVGSGSLTDITRYTAFLFGKSFSCIPTAPSVDAYTSSVAPILVNGVKKTFKAIPPRRIFIDIDILKNAPVDLLRAGIGDIIAKIPARMDWTLSNVLNDEHICDFVWKDIKDLLKEILAKSRYILERDESAVRMLMDAQLVSGINMVIVGNSRPASGAEHMISHLIEMFHEERGEIPPLHGLSVMIGVFVSAKAFELIMEEFFLPKEHFSLEERRKELLEMFSKEKVEEFLKTYEGKKIPTMINLKIIKESLKGLYVEYFPQLQRVLNILDVQSMLKKYSKNFLMKIVRLANTIRARFTVLDVLDGLNLLKPFSEYVFNEIE